TQIAVLPATPAQRREQIELQVALITPLFHVKGYAAPETKAAMQRARLLIEQVETLGEPLENQLLFRVLGSFFAAAYVAFDGDLLRERAAEYLTLAQKVGATVQLQYAHGYLGLALCFTGDIVEAREH